MRTFWLIGCLMILGSCLSAAPQKAVVAVPMTEVWSRPLESGETPKDDLRETQVLFGEKVLIHESSGAWVRIEAVEQLEFTHHDRWEGYPGWVARDSVKVQKWPAATPSRALVREAVIEQARQWMGTAYLWGGLSNGFDCSGLTHRSYRLQGTQIPRDAHEQWMKARPIKRDELKPADLVFVSAEKNPKKIVHVAFYVGEGKLIEAPQTGMVVREISFQDKFGKPLTAVESGDTVNGRTIYFGSFLSR